MTESLKKYFKNPHEIINYSHNKSREYQGMDFHLHEFFEIYFFISGNVNYFIENKVYQLKFGDLLIMNNHEIHRPSVFPGKQYERIVIHFDPSIISDFSLSGMNLASCFINRPKGEHNRIRLNSLQVNEIMYFLARIQYYSNQAGASNSILKFTTFVELLVSLNKLYNLYKIDNAGNSMEEKEYEDTYGKIPGELISLIKYIDKNLDTNLSLVNLEKIFFIDKYYLSRLFKKYTGSNIHEYILYKRISKAKILLSEGHNITNVAMLCGFNDYSNFYRMFKKRVGISPSYYRKKHIFKL
jgi:AraC-like DNA-binding protein